MVFLLSGCLLVWMAVMYHKYFLHVLGDAYYLCHDISDLSILIHSSIPWLVQLIEIIDRQNRQVI